MATTDDNDNQGSSAGEAEISVDDIASENRSCNSERGADNIVDMTTKIQDSSIALNLTSSRSADTVPSNEDGTNAENGDVNKMQTQLITDNDIGDGDEVKGDNCESKSVSKQIVDDVSAEPDESSQPSASDQNSECEITKSEGIFKEDESDSCIPSETLCTNGNVEVSNDDIDEGQRSECNETEGRSETKDGNTGTEHSVREEEEDNKEKEDEEGVSAMDCEESMDSLPQDKTMLVQDESSQSESKDGVNRSETSTPKFTVIIRSDGDDSQEPLAPLDSTSNSNMVCEQPPGGSIASDQNSQSTDEPPMLISSEMECIIRLDEETFVDWNEKRMKMGFGSDAEMAKFLLNRFTEGPSECCDSVPGGNKSPAESSLMKQAEPVKKKTTSLGGIESIVRRLHKVRKDTPDTSRPSSDNEGLNTTDNIKPEPEERCNNSDDAASAAIPKKATTAIYASSGRNGRKRVFVKQEPVDDAWNQHGSPLGSSHEEQQQVNDYANHWPPVRIKQEPVDPVLDSNREAKEGEKPKTLGQFVQNAASWVSQLVATELEKPQESAAAAGPDTPETLFSDSRLHKIIEEQLSKPNEPSVSEKRLHSVIEEQLNKPSPQIGSALLETVNRDALSKAARKEMKKARKEARHAKKLKKAQKREREKEIQKFEEIPQAYSPYEKSYSPFEKSTSPFQSSTSSSPFNKSYSPFEQSTSPFEKPGPAEPVSASHALESFARMVQIREFSGGSAILPQQLSPKVTSASGIQNSLPLVPVPTGIIAASGNPHVLSASPRPATPQSSSKSPAPEIAEVVPEERNAALAPDEHPASLFLKSFAQRTETILQPEPYGAGGVQATSSPREQGKCSPKPVDATNPPQGADSASPLESLLKGAQPPQLSAKSQLEHLLKSKDIKAQWSKPSPVASSQQVPYQVAQAQSSFSPHILKVPKVTLSGRTIKDTAGQDSTVIKGQAFDHILAATGISSDSDDGEARDARDKSKDPDWSQEPDWSSPRKKLKQRKRSYSLLKNTASADGSPTQQTASPLALALSQNMYSDIGAKLSVAGGVDEPAAKHQKLAEGGSWTNGSSSEKPTELSATNTLAKLLQMANRGNQMNQVQSNSSPMTPSKVTAAGSQEQSPLGGRNFSAKSSAFGAMQAFAQLVNIQGNSPDKHDAAMKEPQKLSDSLPPITAEGQTSPARASSKSTKANKSRDQNGGRYQNDYTTKVNGGGMNNRYDADQPEDLTLHSRIQIKMEPLDGDDDVQEVADLSTKRPQVKDFREEPMHYTCSLCSQVFSSVSDVTDHKLRVHYSSSFEIVS